MTVTIIECPKESCKESNVIVHYVDDNQTVYKCLNCNTLFEL